MELVINQSLVKFIEQLVDDDGSVKDSAVGFFYVTVAFLYFIRFGLLYFQSDSYVYRIQSSDLRRARDQVRSLERKVII